MCADDFTPDASPADIGWPPADPADELPELTAQEVADWHAFLDSDAFLDSLDQI